MMRMTMVLALAAVPALAHAQQAPVPIPRPEPVPGRDSAVVAPVALAVPEPGSRAEAGLLGAVEGAASGVAVGARCFSPGSQPVRANVVATGLWGGLRGLITGRRRAHIPTVAATDPPSRVPSRPDPNVAPAPRPEGDRCTGTLPPGTAGTH